MTPMFYYTARARDGSLIRGSIECADERTALSSLRSRAVFVTSLVPAGSVRASLTALFDRPPARAGRIAFFRSFATMIKAGVAINRALEVTRSESANSSMRESIQGLIHDLENGFSLSEAIARRPRHFAPVHAIMVHAGEVSGTLDDVLGRLAASLEREQALHKRLGVALIYPAFVATAALGLVVFLVAAIVPAFESMYTEMHVRLPALTLLLITAGKWLRSPLVWAAVPLFCGLTYIAASFARPRGTGAGVLELLGYRLPLVGTAFRKAALARIARVLGSLMHAGVGVVEAFDVAASASPGVLYSDSLREIGRGLAQGVSISSGFERSRLYDALFLQLVRVGEETGALDAMLLQLADYYEADVESRLSSLSAIVEPLLILFLGGIVGLVVSAIFIPLYSLIGSIR